MKMNNLGGTGIRISAIGFGGSQLGSFQLSKGPKQTKALLREAFDLGITFFDTADVYGRGLSERAIGAAFKRQRDQVVILTKAGYLSPRQKATQRVADLVSRRKSGPGTRAVAKGQDFSPRYLRKALDASLRRLKTDYVDVFLVHSLPVAEVGLPDSLQELEEMRTAGKCRAYGFSLAVHPEGRLNLVNSGVQVVGLPVHPPSESLETTMRRLSEQRVGALAYRPFGSGALFGVDPARGMASHDETASARAAIHYALSLPAVASVVIGTSNRQHLVENLAAVGT
jgi:aryl-alcohol dehydrogenase-like predicted oxidoreductase